jgi:hypothetical protein
MAGRKLWIYRVSGGSPFQLQVKGNPPMVHDGGAESVLRTLCTEEQARTLEEEMRSHGCTVSSNCPKETREQSGERKNLLSVLGAERPFPCARCPECAWFDPYIESMCGAGRGSGPGWDPAVRVGSLSSEKFRNDLDACPLKEAILP